MSTAVLKARIKSKVTAALAAKPGVEGVTVTRNPDGTVSIVPSGVITPVSIDPPGTEQKVLDALCQGIAEAVIEYLQTRPVQHEVTVAGVQPGVAVAKGIATGTVIT